MIDLWLKAIHVMAIISWMAGLLYLPRLFVYHCSTKKGSIQSETFKVMERRLYHAIMGPAMVVSWVVGLLIGWRSGYFSHGWFQAKLVLVLILTGLHVYMGRLKADFANDANQRSSRFFRILNEAPTLVMIAVVILVIVKPF